MNDMKDNAPQDSYDELMHPMENRIFATLACAIREVAESAGLTRQELLQRLPYHAAAYRDQSMHFIHTAFCFDDELADGEDGDVAFLPTAVRQPFPWRLSNVEKRWLRTFLDAPESGFLLSDRLHEQLAKALNDVQPFDFSFIRRSQLAGDDLSNPEIFAVLRTLFACVRRGCMLRLPTGLSLAPLRIRYNFRTNRYSLIAVPSPGDGTPSRYHVPDLIGAQVGKSRTDKEMTATEAAYQHYLDAHRVTVRLRLEDRRNARERCYALFASFDKTSVYLEKEQAYRIDLTYYDFDHADVLSRLLSLGPVVTVLPQEENDEAKRLRHDIVTSLREALPYYQE